MSWKDRRREKGKWGEEEGEEERERQRQRQRILPLRVDRLIFTIKLPQLPLQPSARFHSFSYIELLLVVDRS